MKQHVLANATMRQLTSRGEQNLDVCIGSVDDSLDEVEKNKVLLAIGLVDSEFRLNGFSTTLVKVLHKAKDDLPSRREHVGIMGAMDL
jgi:hypothetical protein